MSAARSAAISRFVNPSPRGPPAGAREPPYPRRSGATTVRVGASAGTTWRQQWYVCGKPCRSSSGGPLGEGYSKREMASELVELMTRLGFDRFAVVGHDRGGRVGYRMALDHAGAVERLGVLNIVPTVDQFERMAGGAALGYWPWLLLAQPAPFPEQLIAAAPEAFLRFVFDAWTHDPSAIDDTAFAVYLEAFAPAAPAICGDYRASFWLDREHDEEDLRAGRRIECPALVVTGAEETQLADAADVWRRWAVDVRAGTTRGGHFLPEEAPDELTAMLGAFLDGSDGTRTRDLRRDRPAL